MRYQNYLYTYKNIFIHIYRTKDSTIFSNHVFNYKYNWLTSTINYYKKEAKNSIQQHCKNNYDNNNNYKRYKK